MFRLQFFILKPQHFYFPVFLKATVFLATDLLLFLFIIHRWIAESVLCRNLLFEIVLIWYHSYHFSLSSQTVPKVKGWNTFWSIDFFFDDVEEHFGFLVFFLIDELIENKKFQKNCSQNRIKSLWNVRTTTTTNEEMFSIFQWVPKQKNFVIFYFRKRWRNNFTITHDIFAEAGPSDIMENIEDTSA